MARQLISPSSLHPAPGFNHIAIATGNKVVHFAGQVALDTEFNVVGGDDLFEQTRVAMNNVALAIKEVGVSWEQIVRRTIYTTQPTEFETITRAIHEVTNNAPDPAQTIVGITGLAIPGLLIEIECTAVIE